MCVCVCVCVSMSDKEREMERLRGLGEEKKRERNRERVRVCVCVCVYLHRVLCDMQKLLQLEELATVEEEKGVFVLFTVLTGKALVFPNRF